MFGLLLFGLLFLNVDEVLFVFAEAFEYIGVRQKIVRHLNRKRSCIHTGVVERHLDIHVSEVAASKSLRDAQGVTVRMEKRIERGLVVEACSFHDKRVALPVADRVSKEGRKIEFFWQSSAVSVDLAVQPACLVKNNAHSGSLNDLDGFGEETDKRETKDF
jgi:hypothetical protein